jgi:hypothetical protein
VFSCQLFGPCADGICRFPENEGKPHFCLASLVGGIVNRFRGTAIESPESSARRIGLNGVF